MTDEQTEVVVWWETCRRDGCIGVRLRGGRCLAHSSRARRQRALRGLGRRRQPSPLVKVQDFRHDVTVGVPITAALLDEILAAVPKDSEGRATFQDWISFEGATFQDWADFGQVIFRGGTQFKQATFQGGASFTWAAFQGSADFHQTTFHEHVGFRGTTFEGAAEFRGATFHGWADFDEATFQDEVRFDGLSLEGSVLLHAATFQNEASFSQATFQGDAWFRGTSFRGRTVFREATFQHDAWFWEATFHGEAEFFRATFQRGVAFAEATFHGKAEFFEATFQDGVSFAGVTFQDEAWFDGAVFEQARQLGPMLVRKQLVLDRTLFKQRTRVEASAAAVCCQGAQFPAGVQLRLRWAEVVLDGADLAAPSILAGIRAPAVDEGRWARALQRLSPLRTSRPRLLSVRGADVAGLTVSNVDLRACRFTGAHNLDKLRLQGEVLFVGPPGRWYLTRRQTLAEEHHWRHDAAGHRKHFLRATGSGRDTNPIETGEDRRGQRLPTRWYGAQCQPPPWLAMVEPPEPGQVAALYRALRKALEDAKDEPGAADFYYGEMEMRRHARLASVREALASRTRQSSSQRARRERGWSSWLAAGVEYGILSAYWLLSGYALRAWRALTAFAVLLVLFALLVTYVGGFAPQPALSTSANSHPTSASTSPSTMPPPNIPPATTATTADTAFSGALIYGARTVIGLTRDPQPQLTRWGEVMQILLRIVGPVLLGLAVFSVRGRVKR